MRLTRSKDGVMRANVRVAHRLSEHDMTELLAAASCRHFSVGELPVLSKATAQTAIRRELESFGLSSWDWHERADEDDVRDRRAWARRMVEYLVSS
jgi:hypothetical protein